MYTFSIAAFVSVLALASSASSLSVGRQAAPANGQVAQPNGQATPATSSSPKCGQTYTIPQSESCLDVASQHGLDQPGFVALNPGINCDAPLSPGQVVCVHA